MQLEKVTVKNWKGEGSVNINKADFDADVHEMWDESKADEKPEGEAVVETEAPRKRK